jgi:transcription elongation factor GreA
MENYLTPEGLEKLKKELDDLENVQRKELAEKLNYAISFGDLRENAAYHQAKEQQAFAEGRILELKSIIANAKIIEKGGNDRVRLGSSVILSCGGAKEKYVIVGPDEADIFAGKVSYRSPLGEAVLGKKPGDKVILKTPGGKIAYEIKEII